MWQLDKIKERKDSAMQNQIVNSDGFFQGGCEDCVHSMRTGQDRGNPDKNNREMYCEMYSKTFYPKNLQEIKCSHYRMKLWSMVKRILIVILAIYLALCFIELIVSIL